MQEEYRKSIEKYLAVMHIFKLYLTDGTITEEEFWKMEEHYAQKYCIKISNIYRLNKLLFDPFRANMCIAKRG